jgi:hypothetical protein
MLAVSPSGRALYVAGAYCNTVLVRQARIRSASLPRLRARDAAVPKRPCRTDTDEGDVDLPLTLEDLVALPHGRLALLVLPALRRTGAQEPDLAVYVGRPGRAFKRTVLPDTATVADAVIARDASSGRLYVASTRVQDPSGTQSVQLWASNPTDRRWRAQPLPARIPEGDGVSGLAAAHGQLWLGLINRNYLPYVAHRASSGRWQRPASLPGVHPVFQLLLAAAPGPGVRVWELDDRWHPPGGQPGPPNRRGNGLERRLYTSGHGWSQPKRLTHTKIATSLQLAVTRGGEMRYAYEATITP